VLVVEEFARLTDTGRQRRANEDSFFARKPLFVVADGMGGAQAGEIASGIAVSVFERGLPDGPGSPEQRLVGMVGDANEQIHDLSVADPEHAGMGTTLTALYVGEEDVAVAHVGDSRLYVWRDGELRKLTRDHSLVEELVEEGRLTPEEADEHPQRSIITRALGPEHNVQVDSQTFSARDGDVFLVCSDGLTSMVSEAHIAQRLAAGMPLAEAARTLVADANEAGGRDNITVVLVRVAEVAVGEIEQTMVGADAPPVVTVAEPAGNPQVERRLPRAPVASGTPPKRKRLPRLRRAFGPLVVIAVLFAAIGTGGYFATQSVYFAGSDDDGFVTLYRGVPYELPFGLKLYSRNYTSGVALQTLDGRVKKTVVDHEMRSRRDAADLIAQIEQGKIAGQDGN
jgi:serine/threonine protein phosphatase PrpC